MDEERRPVGRSSSTAGVALAAFAALAVAACRSEPPPAAPLSPTPADRPDLVLYVVDTLRADRLALYGHDRPTSPRLDAFARQAVRFAEARAQSSWTKPAMATILTGLYPVAHGAERRAQGIAADVVTLAERLGAAGYLTAMFTTNPTVVEKFGFARGFDRFDYVHQLQGKRRRSVDSGDVQRSALAWLDGRSAAERERPLFLVIHTLDPHDPYRPAEPFRSRFAPGVEVESACCFRGARLGELSPEQAAIRRRDSLALYDGEIAENDESFGGLLDALRARGLYEEAAILFTSDHGEEFFEHGGWRHAETLFEEVLRIPMVLRLPGGESGGVVLPGPADQIDVAPTLLELAGLPSAPELPGGSWLAAIRGGAAPPRESMAWLRHPAFEVAAIRDGGWKWLRHDGPRRSGDAGAPAESLFDLAADPDELVNRLEREPELRRELAKRSRDATARHRRTSAAGEVEIDDELDRELRALGYL